jgi:micrococcal nuclease
MIRPRPRLLFSILLLAGLSAFRLQAATPEVLEGTVVRVMDGDTIEVLDDRKDPLRVRLLGIDAPESRQPFGKVARQVLRDRVILQRVKVLVQDRDRYGRLLGKVTLEGIDINLELVREGLAWHYVHFANNQFPGDARLYAQAEREARTERRGIWKQSDAQAPWEWRKSHPRL